MSDRSRAYLAWITICVVWGTTYLAIRIAIETMPPFLMTGFRWVAAGALLSVGLVARGVRLPPPADWPGLAVLGILLMGFGNGAVAWAEQSVPSGLAAVLVAAIPFWMVGMERLRAHSEPIGRRQLAGLLLGFLGIVMLVWPELDFGQPGSFLAGAIATQIACVGWAIGSSYARRRRDHILAGAAVQMLMAGVGLLLLGTAAGEWSRLSFNARTIGALAYLVGVGSVLGYSAYAYALRHLPIATVSLYAYLNPIIAVVLGTIVLGEPLGPRIITAGAVVLAGVALVRSGR
ncbi:MAG: EamA family transporter [Vicinamibacterales bacterium]